MKAWFRENRSLLGLIIVNRLFIFFVAYSAIVVLAPNPKELHINPKNLLLEPWTRWDTGWYVEIAQKGYSDLRSNGEGHHEHIKFYPV